MAVPPDDCLDLIGWSVLYQRLGLAGGVSSACLCNLLLVRLSLVLEKKSPIFPKDFDRVMDPEGVPVLLSFFFGVEEGVLGDLVMVIEYAGVKEVMKLDDASLRKTKFQISYQEDINRLSLSIGDAKY